MKTNFRLISDRDHKPVISLQGNIKEASFQKKLVDYNLSGYGIHKVINIGGTRDNDITDVVAQFIDIDTGLKSDQLDLIKSFPLKYSVLVESRRGYHVYWNLDENSDIKRFKHIQLQLIKYFSSDSNITSLAHCMRVPGFYNMKDETPFLVSIIEQNDLYYSQDELSNCMPVLVEEPKKAFSVTQIIPKNSRNQALFNYATSNMSRGLNEIVNRISIQAMNQYQTEEPLDNKEVDKIVSETYKRYELGNIKLDTNIPFPIDVIPSPMKDIIISVSESLQVPIEFVALASIGIFSSVLARRYRIQIKKDWIENANIWTACIMNAGERKSSVLSFLQKPIYEFESNYNSAIGIDYKLKLLQSNMEKAIKKSSEEDLILSEEALKEHEKNTPKKINLIVSDVTKEKLMSLMHENQDRMLISSAEGGFIKGLSEYSTTRDPNISNILSCWSGDYINVQRANKEFEPIIMKNPLLSVVIAFQESILNNLMNNPQLRSEGFVSRFIISNPKSKIGTRVYESPDIPLEIEMSWHDLLNKYLKQDINKVIMLTMSHEAHLVSKEFSEWLEVKQDTNTGEYKHMRDFTSKLHSQIIKIAIQFHLLTNSESNIVSGETLSNAISFGKFALYEAIKIYGIDTTVISLTDTEIEFIKKEAIAGVDRDEFIKAFETEFSTSVYDKANFIKRVLKITNLKLSESKGKLRLKYFM